MSYLTFEEYKDIGLDDAITAEEFSNIRTRAEIVIDNYTRDFYREHELETDCDERKRRFKLAIAFQIEYMKKTGFMTSEDKLGSPKSVSQSIGGTTLSKSFADGGGTLRGSNISSDSVNALVGTGLLYRGVFYA